MKKFKKWFGFMVAIVAMIFCSGTAFAIADDPAITSPVGDLNGGPGVGVAGDNNRTQSQAIMEGELHDLDYYQKQINKHIVEMKLESCPVDQILRSSNKTNKSSDIVVKYYQIGQRPIMTTLQSAVNATSSGVATALEVVNNTCFDSMDTIIFPGIKGYLDDGATRDTLKPLMVRVVGRNDSLYPLVIAVNGKKNVSKNNRWDLPDIPAGAVMLRLGRAAGEKDVETSSYYDLPEASEQYCQRFIMQAEESVIERMSQKVVDWDFTKQERIAMDDMRDGMERSGLFGIKSVGRYGKNGNVYTTGGVYWEAGKDLELGHWQPKLEIGTDGEKHAVTIKKQGKDGDGHLLYTAPVTGQEQEKDVFGHLLYNCEVSAVATIVYTTDNGTTWYNTSGVAVTPDATPTAKMINVTKDTDMYTTDEGTTWKDLAGNTITPDSTPTKKMVDVPVYEYAISEKELTAFVDNIIHDAGNGSRTKLLFVDNLIYMAFSNLKAERRIITQTETNYQNWHLDFESFTSMGTKILLYRHDAFNYMGMSGCAFLLDPRYLEKWIFGNWSRQEYDLKELFIRNSNAVVMEEFSCWTLYFPNAHARVTRPEFDSSLGETDEIQVAA